ncbi:MAG: RNA methyltransferase [Proteobacteria bacterium]|nr:MAG: RNA methyltransferase [Pseudomonadota bacterium]
MAYDKALAERIREALARRKDVEEKTMFGGISFLLNGNLLVALGKKSLIVRLGPEQAEEALKKAHVKEFNMTGRSMKGWVLINPEGLKRNDQLNYWIRLAVNFVVKLPAKPSKA